MSLEIVFGAHVRFRQVVECLTHVASKVVFVCLPNQIRLWGRNDNDCWCYTDIKFQGSACRRYTVPIPGSATQPYVFGVKVQPLMKKLRSCKKKDNTAVVLSVVDQSLKVKFISDHTGQAHQPEEGGEEGLPLLSAEDMQTLYPLPVMPSLATLHRAVLSSQEFKKICLEMTVVGNGTVARFTLPAPCREQHQHQRLVLETDSDQSDGHVVYELCETAPLFPGSMPVVISRLPVCRDRDQEEARNDNDDNNDGAEDDNSSQDDENDSDNDEAAEAKSETKTVVADSAASECYALKYLNFFAKPAQLKPVYAQAQQVCLGFAPGQPLVVRYLLENVGDITFYLQPLAGSSRAAKDSVVGMEGVFSAPASHE